MDGIHFRMMKTNKGIKILLVKDHTETPIFFRSQEYVRDKVSFHMGAFNYDPFF